MPADILNATNGDDVILVFGDDGGVSVLELASTLNIAGFEEGLDKLIINALDGDDVVEASGLNAGLVFEADGGEGSDVLLGSERADTLFGGKCDDVLTGGNGLDICSAAPPTMS